MKSLTETNSGKLITIVNSDIQQIERPLGVTVIMIGTPVVNILAYVIIVIECGWLYSGITFGIWLVIMGCQHLSARKGRSLKGIESASNDERQRYVQDMITGARTIKCYGWE